MMHTARPGAASSHQPGSAGSRNLLAAPRTPLPQTHAPSHFCSHCPQAAGKRPAKQPPAATPQPAKRGKAEAPKAAPATAPPKVAAGLPADDKQYLAALKAHLKSKGTTKLAALGSAVKRPAKAPKLKHFLEQHK